MTKVLLIEDDEVLRQLYQKVIMYADDFDVSVFTGDLSKVVDLIDWHDIDVVVADQILGSRVFGSEILKWLENHFPSIWRVMLTGDDMIRPSDTHANLLLFKPVYPEQLIRSLRKPNGQ